MSQGRVPLSQPKVRKILDTTFTFEFHSTGCRSSQDFCQVHFGSAPYAYVGIVSDKRWPGMYRLKRTDGRLSDMVNLTRARDALRAAQERRP